MILKKLKRCDVLFEFFTMDTSAIPRLKTYVQSDAQPNEQKIVSYLANGTTLLVSPGVERDIIDPNKIAGPQHILTDGVWVWPAVGVHYVNAYHIKLPDDFVNHMYNNEWNAFEVPEDQIIELYKSIEPEDDII